MKLRVAMLSKWHVHAAEYAQTLQGFSDVQLTTVWDEDPARGAAWAEALGAAFEPELEKVLASPDIDAVVVDTPTRDHARVMVAAARAGKHIFTEKVLAATMAEARQIEEAVRGAGVKFCISYPQRTHGKIQYAKQVLEQGLLGTVSLLRIRNAHGGASQGWLPEYWYDAALAGGGAMLDLGAHPNYQAAYLLGAPRRATALFNTLAAPGGIEDNAVSVFAYEKGAIAVLETGFVTPYSPWRLELYGTEGALLMEEDVVRLRSEKLTPKGWFAPDASSMPAPLPMPLRMFVDGVLYDQPILFDIDQALALTQMMEMAYRSSRERREVSAD